MHRTETTQLPSRLASEKYLNSTINYIQGVPTSVGLFPIPSFQLSVSSTVHEDIPSLFSVRLLPHKIPIIAQFFLDLVGHRLVRLKIQLQEPGPFSSTTYLFGNPSLEDTMKHVSRLSSCDRSSGRPAPSLCFTCLSLTLPKIPVFFFVFLTCLFDE